MPAATVDTVRATLTEMTKPGTSAEKEDLAKVAQEITLARYAMWKAEQKIYPVVYPPPPAGNGADVFAAADEAGEGVVTFKEFSKYLGRTQNLSLRLGKEGFQHLSSHFDIENLEDCPKEHFMKLWQESAAMREAAPAAAPAAAHVDPVATEASKAVDAERAILTDMTKPGTSAEKDDLAKVAQKITLARYALYNAEKRLYPVVYPPPPAGDGADVFAAADEAGEGEVTFKEFSKYLGRTQNLSLRLGKDGFEKLCANFSIENLEDCPKETFMKLWQESAKAAGRA